jgi:HEAT repeat protein
MKEMDSFDESLPDDEAHPTFEQALEVIKSASENVSSDVIMYGLSDLMDFQVSQLRNVFQTLDVNYRQVLIEVLIDEGLEHFELNFDAVGKLAIQDQDAHVRQSGVELLAESEDIEVMDRLIQLAEHDSSLAVREESIRVLGHFILLGELGDLDEEDTHRAQKLVLKLYKDTTQIASIRAEALVALANCSHEHVERYITESYKSTEPELRLGAILAMGSTADEERWGSTIINALESDDEDIVQAAIRSSGALQLTDAVRPMSKMLKDAERDLTERIIEALGEIASKQAIRVLEDLLEHAEEIEDEELMMWAEDALEHASMPL